MTQTNVSKLFADRKLDFNTALQLSREEEPETAQGVHIRYNKIKGCFHSGEFAVLDQLSFVDALPVHECKSAIAASALMQHELISKIKLQETHYHLTSAGREVVETLWPYRFKSNRRFA